VVYSPRSSGVSGVGVRSKMQKFGFRFILPQIIFAVLMALAWWRISTPDMISALLGGFAVILPSFCFSQYFLGQIHTKSPQKVLIAFYIGELLKLVSSVLMMLIFVKVFKVGILPLVTGFIGAHVGTWFTPFFTRKRALS
jgi:ATP synthase protein I